jgi:HEAT repeat protein
MPTLVAALQFDTSQEVRCSAVWALAKWFQETRVARNALLSILQRDQEQSVRIQAARALEQWGKGSAEFLTTWMELAQKDPNPSMRQIAVRSLGAYGKKRQEVLGIIITVLQEDLDRYVRMEAATILESMNYKHPAIVATLLEILSTPRNRYDVRDSANLLRRYGRDYEIIEPLLNNLRSESEKIRYTCARRLEVLGQSSRDIAERIVNGLIRIIEDPELNKHFYPEDHSRIALTLPSVAHAYETLWTITTSGILVKG